MADFTFDSILRQGAGGQTGSDGIRYALPATAQLFHSQMGSIWFAGASSPGNRDIGAHQFDLTSLDPELTVTRVVFKATAWFAPTQESVPAPVYTSGPAWDFHMGHNIFIDPQYTFGDLFGVKNFGLGNPVRWNVPAIPGSSVIEVDLDPAWIDPTKDVHDLEIEDVSVYTSGWRFYVFMSHPFFTPSQLVVSVAPPVSTVEVDGGRRTVFEVEGGRSLSHGVSGGRRQVHAGDGGRLTTHSLVGGRRKVFDAEGGRGR